MRTSAATSVDRRRATTLPMLPVAPITATVASSQSRPISDAALRIASRPAATVYPFPVVTAIPWGSTSRPLRVTIEQ